MVLAALHPVTLDEFSQLPNIEESPAWEFLNGQVLQKPMPTFYHSLLQKYLVRAIDNTNSTYEAFPELRCILSKGGTTKASQCKQQQQSESYRGIHRNLSTRKRKNPIINARSTFGLNSHYGHRIDLKPTVETSETDKV